MDWNAAKERLFSRASSFTAMVAPPPHIFSPRPPASSFSFPSPRPRVAASFFLSLSCLFAFFVANLLDLKRVGNRCATGGRAVTAKSLKGEI